MTKITTLDLNPLFRNSIGFDSLFDRITHQIGHSASTNYPPYNIIETSDTTTDIELAVAGFGIGEIDITLDNGQLIITGEKSTPVKENIVYRHQGISARRFVRTFSLADYVSVSNAVVTDGILTVSLERIIPEAKKPKSFAITYQS